MLPLVVHQNGGEELGCSRWSFTRTDTPPWLLLLPLVVHQNFNGREELGCSRWSFTRTVGRSPECPRPLHPLHKLTDRDGPPDVHRQTVTD